MKWEPTDDKDYDRLEFGQQTALCSKTGEWEIWCGVCVNRIYHGKMDSEAIAKNHIEKLLKSGKIGKCAAT